MRRGAIRATATIAVVIASFCTLYALCVRAGSDVQPAIVAAVLAMSLGRRRIPTHGARLLLVPLTLTGVGLAASGVGWLLITRPYVGAVVFVLGMFLSVVLRNGGERGRTVGSLIALPLIAILIVPGPTGASHAGPVVHLALLLLAGLVAFAFALLAQQLARVARLSLFDPEPVRMAVVAGAARPGLTAHTRMAYQMAAALAAAFVIGFSVFPGHWGWAVLTAFIVCSGARGRGDAAYKGVLRLLGAVAGTLAAAALTHLWLPSGVGEALAIFAILSAGFWLRDINYAYWAACMTLVLGLLAANGGFGNGATTNGFLALRLQAILAGAICAVAATWFVFPIRTQAVIRRRLADALRAFDELLVHAHESAAEHEARLAHFEYRLGELEKLAPPVRWHRRLFERRLAPDHPAHWIDRAAGLRSHARAPDERIVARGSRHGQVRRALGISRRAIADHGKPDAPPDAPSIGTALDDLHAVLAMAAGQPKT